MKILTIVCLIFLSFSGAIVVTGKPAGVGSSSDPLVKGSSMVSLGTGDVFDLSDFGSTGDGITDDGPALQAALNAIAAAGGGRLFVPAGRYAIKTPVKQDFSGLADSITIQGVQSFTPAPPPNASGDVLTKGLDLSSEFAPGTGQSVAIAITGLQRFLIQDITFIGTPLIETDAAITLALTDVWEANIKHCEFYGLSSLVAYGSIIQSVRSHLNIEQSVFLGSTCNSGVYGSVVQNIEWKGITVANTVFVDYGQRPELFGKTGLAAPFSWVNIGNAAAPEPGSPRREAVIRDVFLDEGGLMGLSSIPYKFSPPTAPIDLIYVSGLYMNVSNLGTSGNYLDGAQGVLIENSHYGWSHNADTAINLLNVGTAILDQVECIAAANRIRAAATTGKLTVIDSVYTYLDSQSPATRVITTTSPEDDPVYYIRAQFNSILNRNPDAAAHFYWSNLLLACGEHQQCIDAQRLALSQYLGSAPAATFSISGRVTNENGEGLSGTTITLSGSQSVVTQTGAHGEYSFERLPTSGVYTIAANRVNYTIALPTKTITTPSGDKTVDFAAAINHYQLAGRALNSLGQGIANATVTLSGSQTGSTLTDSAGHYVFTVPAEGSYTITPAQPTYLFSPASANFDNLGGDRTADFTGTGFNSLQFGTSSYSVSEGARRITVTVTRSGDTSNSAEVVYSASDGSAQQRSDVIPIVGRLSFEPGQTSNSFDVLITDDSYIEGSENLTLALQDVVGGTLGENKTAMLTIIDNDTSEAQANPIDDAQFFVRQQYRDFLSRSADAEGLAFWTDQISSCGTDAACIEDRRINVSAAFFLSIEFQETGFLVYRLYKASYAQLPQHLNEFLLDTRTIGQDVIVNAPGWQELLEANKVSFIQDFVVRPRFSLRYPVSLTPFEFVTQLNANAGGTLSASDIAAAVADFGGAATSEDPVIRARVLRLVAESQTFSQREHNPAFVLQQYFGYLQRDPNDTPDTNFDGYNFWLQKLNDFHGDFRRAEMVNSFLISSEYRARFGSH